MEFEQGLEVVSRAFSQASGRPLTQVEVALLHGAWNHLTYDRIAERSGYSTNYLQRDIGPKFWKLLSQALGCQVNKTTLRATLTHLDQLIPHPIRLSGSAEAHPQSAHVEAPLPISSDWSESPDVTLFYGGSRELEQLSQWVLSDRPKLVALLGLGGIGKTALVTKLAQQLAPEFEFVIWRSLRNAPTLTTLLGDLVPFLSNQQDTEPTLTKLLQYLRQSRCLLVLDNAETLLEAKQAGQFRAGFEDYEELLQRVAEVGHQSCVLLTSREQPGIVATFAGAAGAVRSRRLTGSPEAGQAILQSKGLQGTPEQQQQLSDRYGHNPLALKIVATSILMLFDGRISDFLQEDTLVFHNIRRLFDQQFQRLSELEQSLMYWMAINREWMSLAEFKSDIVPAVPTGKLLESLEALSFRCLIEQQGTRFTQQPVVMEYVTEQLLDRAIADLQQPTLNLLTTHALLKATAKDYIRETQKRLIIEPLCDRLLHQWQNRAAIVQQIQFHLNQLRHANHSGYGAGNLINLLCHLNVDLTGADFSGLTLRQAYLRETPLHRTNFAHSTHIQSVFSETMTDVFGIAISPDNQLLAMSGGKSGMLFIYDLATGRWLHSLQAHQNWTLSVTFAPMENHLLTGSLDGTICEWDAITGYRIRTWQTSPVRYITVSPDTTAASGLLAGACENSIQIWDLHTLDCIQTLTGHACTVTTVEFHPHQPWLVSSSQDFTIKLWNYRTGECLATFHDHTQMVMSVQFNPQGTGLASLSADGTAKLWSLATQDCLHTFAIDTALLRPLAFSPDGRLLALSGDGAIRLWNLQTYQLVRSFPNSANPANLCFSADGQLLVSTPDFTRVHLWEVATGRCLKILQSQLLMFESIAIHPQRTQFASGSDDGSLRLWHPATGECLAVLSGHGGKVSQLAYHPQNPIFASCSYDRTVKLWSDQGDCLRSLSGHDIIVGAVVFHPEDAILIASVLGTTIQFWDTETGHLIDTMAVSASAVIIFILVLHPQGHLFATGSEDGVVRLWDYRSRQLVRQWSGHQARVWALAFHPQGHWLASGGHDDLVKVWEIESGDCVMTLQGSSNILAVQFSPDGRLLAFSCDRAIEVWNLTPLQRLHTFTDHTGNVSSLAFLSADLLVSASYDETIRYWHLASGECVKILRPDRLYEGMDITGAQGLSAGQQAMLERLGATVQTGTVPTAAAIAASSMEVMG